MLATHDRVIGGRHDGASFAPSNGVAARSFIDDKIVDLEKQRREMAQGFAMIARRRKKKHKID